MKPLFDLMWTVEEETDREEDLINRISINCGHGTGCCCLR
jgi:hypothetical protein